MVESTRPVQTRDPFDRFDEAINDPRLYETSRYEQPYELPYERSETLHEERLPHEPVPLFLSSYEEEPINRFPNTPSRAAIEKKCGCRAL